MDENLYHELDRLSARIEGEVRTDRLNRIIYATDASVYREMPQAVIFPKSKKDLRAVISFCARHRCGLIPRTAGTSLAGQVVGNGIVVDVSRHMTRILEVNQKEGWARVEPGVIRNELNLFVKKAGLFFAPETSTSSRAMIGGMVGNNSCGANSVRYGSTREHVLSITALLSDGSEIEFSGKSAAEFQQLCADGGSGSESGLYRAFDKLLADPEVRRKVLKQFPKPSITRRNTGYALDMLLDGQPWREEGLPFNFCRLLAGSEGTLALITEIKVNLEPLPPDEAALVCVHFRSVDEALRANVEVLPFNPVASELIDHFILDCTKAHREYAKSRFFLEGEPRAILAVELTADSPVQLKQRTDALISHLKNEHLGYAYPVLQGADRGRVWELRKAGLGLLSNIPGDAKPLAVIEDTAVDPGDLPAFIREFSELLKEFNLQCVLYGHAGSGELHIRPLINIKTGEGKVLFRSIAESICHLVKKYRGSLSGEHGDGRLRGEFLKEMVGEEVYALLVAVKEIWDPLNIFNPGKIIDTPPMDEFLRYQAGQKTTPIDTIFDFSERGGILRAAEMCNGSGDCRKTRLTGGTMCPSYMATLDEKDTTRARANVLREILTRSNRENPFDSEEIKEVLDLCLSCKGCKSECPSNVDMAKLKAEFLQHYYDVHGVPLRSQMVGYFPLMSRLLAPLAAVYNFLNQNSLSSSVIKRLIGFHPQRSIPLLNRKTVGHWFRNQAQWDARRSLYFIDAGPGGADHPGAAGRNTATAPCREVFLFLDEFTNYNDVALGIKTIELLNRLGYRVLLVKHAESGRTWLSKGLLRKARKVARRNVACFSEKVSPAIPLVGIEPSAILAFRDEYPDLLRGEEQQAARLLSQSALLFEEFIVRELDAGNIDCSRFINEEKTIHLHGHCQQKAHVSLDLCVRMLQIPVNFRVRKIPSGCCGMAGSFGFEKEHYDISMKIGELVLFPAIRNAGSGDLIAASGTSCRHQILDGTGCHALHPIEILHQALR